MKIFVFITVLFGVITSALGQDVQDYQYVKVPVKFDFLKEENQYQLNALTAFLFDKKGYEVIFRENIPAGVPPCEVLQADLHNKSGLFRSRLYFTLKNCKNEIVFTSDTGESREKDYKTSYQEALRNAFDSLEEFDPSKKEILVDPKVSSDEIEALEEQQREIIIDPQVNGQKTEVEKTSSAEKVAMEAASEEKKFTNGPLSYILKPTPNGFELFKEGNKEKFATLLKSGGGNNFLYASKNISGNAFFDTSGNLVVEYLDPNTHQLVTVVYQLQAQ